MKVTIGEGANGKRILRFEGLNLPKVSDDPALQIQPFPDNGPAAEAEVRRLYSLGMIDSGVRNSALEAIVEEYPGEVQPIKEPVRMPVKATRRWGQPRQ